jgi:serine/threonine protein kinase
MSNQSGKQTVHQVPPLPNLGGRFSINHHPTTFGRFEVVKTLGKGACGTVYLVKDKSCNRFVLKVSNADCARYLQLEYHAGRSILNPCIVPALELFEDGEFTCLLFEYMPGQTLTEYMSEYMKKPQSMRVKKLLVQQLVLAIAHLHTVCKIAHLDLKPDNILVVDCDGTPVVKIIDFGLACPFQLLAPGATGTLHYMAPEVAMGIEFDEKADIWSLGKIIAWIVTNENDFLTGNHNVIVQLMHVVNIFTPPIPKQMNSDPEMAWALQLCLACLAIDPNARASAMELVQMCASLKFD